MSIGHHLDELRVLEQEQSQELVNGHLPPEKQEDEQTTIKRRVAAILKMRHDRMRDAKVSLLSPLPSLYASHRPSPSLIFTWSLILPLCHLYSLHLYVSHPSPHYVSYILLFSHPPSLSLIFSTTLPPSPLMPSSLIPHPSPLLPHYTLYPLTPIYPLTPYH